MFETVFPSNISIPSFVTLKFFVKYEQKYEKNMIIYETFVLLKSNISVIVCLYPLL